MNALEDPRLLSPRYYVESFMSIQTKEQKVLPFVMNPVQRSYVKRATEHGIFPAEGGYAQVRVMKRGLRDLILKGRQHGFSTLILALYLADTMSNESTNTTIIAHKADAAGEMLNAIRFMYNSIPDGVPKAALGRDNAGVLEFPGLGSKITVGVVGSGSVRSTTIHNLLCTETAFWGRMESTMAAALEAVPANGNAVVESTPNGVGGWYYSKVIEARGGRSSWRMMEYPWFLNKNYRIPRAAWGKYPAVGFIPGKNKMSKFSQDEIALIQAYKLDEEQIAWRRWKIGESSARMFAQEYECDFVQSGRRVFERDYVEINPLAGLIRVRAPGKEGSLNVIERPQPGRQYVIGADVAEGLADGDYDVATVIDKFTGDEVAKLRGQWPVDVYSEKMVDLSEMYGWAAIGIERNNHGHAAILRVKQLLYEKGKLNRLYYGHDMRYGWVTSSVSKTMMITDLEEAMRKGEIHPREQNTIDELMAYVHIGNGSTGAPAGVHDDSVMALAIANQMRRFHVPDDVTEQAGDSITARVIG